MVHSPALLDHGLILVHFSWNRPIYLRPGCHKLVDICGTIWLPTVPIWAEFPVAFASYGNNWMTSECPTQYQNHEFMILNLKSGEWATQTSWFLMSDTAFPANTISRVHHTIFWRNRVRNKKEALETAQTLDHHFHKANNLRLLHTNKYMNYYNQLENFVDTQNMHSASHYKSTSTTKGKQSSSQIPRGEMSFSCIVCLQWWCFNIEQHAIILEKNFHILTLSFFLIDTKV